MKNKYLALLYLLAVAAVGFFAVCLLKGDFGSAVRPAQEPVYTEDTVAVLSVGQANSALISSGGKYCLIDAGSTDSGHTEVVEYLYNAGVEEIELLVVTHFHVDHTSELIDVIDSFRVKNIVIPDLSVEKTPTNAFFDLFLSRVEDNDINLDAAVKGREYAVGNGTVTIVDNTYNDLTVNDTSVATVFCQGDFVWLNTADGEEQYEERLLDSFSCKVTLFTAGHHGSSSSSTQQLLEAIQPEYVAVSAGADNEYGHPHREVIQRFEKMGISYSITFEKGTLVYSIADKKLIED